MKFHHIGVACRNIKEELESITKVHNVTDIGSIQFDPEQKVEFCMLKTSENITIELLSGEQVENIIKKRITYYHLCFETDDIDFEIKRLHSIGALIVSEPKPAIQFENRRVAFLQVSYGLIELLQAKK